MDNGIGDVWCTHDVVSKCNLNITALNQKQSILPCIMIKGNQKRNWILRNYVWSGSRHSELRNACVNPPNIFRAFNRNEQQIVKEMTMQFLKTYCIKIHWLRKGNKFTRKVENCYLLLFLYEREKTAYVARTCENLIKPVQLPRSSASWDCCKYLLQDLYLLILFVLIKTVFLQIKEKYFVSVILCGMHAQLYIAY